ncbi:Arc family DNA-binding protein [Klebsiella variicola]|uniref:Arc family DNA-binding protein n=1 Tax=Klebsiella pneumoniae complex TaxID=3390273 RepID=UPI001E555E08|nr:MULTISPECIES: Arc family DNA-binding protein [Klebsiella]EMB5927798.1 Arc family DNA-binding protein [Klebsiella pneumoniae]MDI0467040.1 Arc family DNA-binding protein [Klebsiella variicola]
MIVSSKAPKYNMRIPADVKEAIEKAAEAEGRSINTEMVMRLIDSLKKDGLFVPQK